MQSVQSQISPPLKIWERIKIIVGSDAEVGEYEARIEDFLNGGIVITKPEFVQGKTLLRDGVQVFVQFTREDAAYEFASCIKRCSIKGANQMLLVPPVRCQRVQRRMFVRIQTSSKVSHAPLLEVKGTDNWEESLQWEHSSCVDISGGGVLISVADKIRPKTLLLLNLEFFVERDLPEKVVGICRRAFTKEKQHLIGVEFLLASRLSEFVDRKILRRLPQSVKEFDAMAQNRLVSSIFSEQVELRQKGLL